MKNSKRVVAFLLAMSVVGAYSPMCKGGYSEIVAFANADAQSGALTIVNQPQSVTVPNGEKASFTVAAQGEGLTSVVLLQFKNR